MLSQIAGRREPWDLLVIGGGATGLGIALDAASRGYRVLLLEQSDFGKGTSSRSTKLKRASRARVKEILARASYKPAPHQRRPHALARDNQGNYYYVDRGASPETERDFRIYIGPRGRAKLQRMKDIVSDSEAQTYSTERGALRLILGKSQAVWMTKNKKQLGSVGSYAGLSVRGGTLECLGCAQETRDRFL